MANFTRKQIPFLHNGMSWNAPVEKLPDGVPSWCKNTRVLVQGTISSAHGFTPKFRVAGRDFLHSMSRLNILNELLNNAGAGPAFDPALACTYVLGADYQLNVFQDQTTLDNTTLNPVTTPLGIAGFSGNPLSIVDMQPVSAAVAWKYIADSKQMVSVGYYPGDNKGQNMARCLTMGLDPPTFDIGYPVYLQGPAQGVNNGNLTGNYQWAFVFRRVQTGAQSNPSAATRFKVSNPNFPANADQALMTLPQTPIDPQTGQPDQNIVVDVYRFGGNVLRWALVGTGKGGSQFIDNTLDVNLLAAPAPSQVTDSTTGLTRFNLYRPWVIEDIARQGFAYVNQDPVTGIYYLTPDPGGAAFNEFNPQWLPGSTIYLNGVACTIYQIQSSQKLEIADDLTNNPLVGVGTVDWSTSAGTLMAGQALPHLWGPYGIGQSGSYLFACGDPSSRGTLYWTNGNDPDSTDLVNSILVTSASEKLVTGCVYAGQPYVWSTERQFQIYPSLTVFGQFTTQELPGAKGCWCEWSLSVQSNGLADQSVTWRGKDGIYDMSTNGLQRLTNPLYPFFPHDNQPSIAPETLIAAIGASSKNPEHVGNLDDTQPQYHRLTWFHGLLFYDFVALTTNPSTGASQNTYSTLVYDSINIPNGGWVSLDQPFETTNAPVVRCIEIGANDPNVDNKIEPGPIYGPMYRGGNLLVLRSLDNTPGFGAEPEVSDYYGYTRGFQSRVITKAEDLGDSRAQKRWGDFWLDCTPLNDFTVYPLAGFSTCSLLPIQVSDSLITPDFCPTPAEPGDRAQYVMDFAEFKGADGAALMTPTLALDIIWTAVDGQFSATLAQWSPSYVLKPEVISLRASDPDDQGQLQAKYLTGFNLEANTFGLTQALNVLIDGNPIDTLNINHNGQSEHPYAFTPTAGYETQIQMQDTDGVPPAWQFYKINWIFEVWPDATTRASFPSDLGYTGSKFIQGAIIPMETGGQQVTFQVNGDCNQSATLGPVSTPNLCKMDLAFAFGPCNTTPSDPFIASSVQVVPSDAARIWYDQIRWIWEPEPELVATWVTQPTDFDLPGWHSQRDCYIAYRGGSGAPTLHITTEYGTESYLLDPVSANQYTRCYRVLKPQKAKWRYFRVESCGLFRLYLKDCEVRAKSWGDPGAYKSFQPFGDLSRNNGGARI